MIIYYIICLLILLFLIIDEKFYINFIPTKNTIIYKSAFLILILGISFIDIELALLLTLLFLILIIKTNKRIVNIDAKKEKFETVPLNYYIPKTLQDVSVDRDEKLFHKVENKNTSQLLNPYTEYINLLMNENSLDIIQTNKINFI